MSYHAVKKITLDCQGPLWEILFGSKTAGDEYHFWGSSLHWKNRGG